MSVFIGTCRLFQPFLQVAIPVVCEEVPDVGGGNETGPDLTLRRRSLRISGDRGRGPREAVITVVVPGRTRSSGKTEARALMDARRPADQVRRPEVFRGGETQGDDPVRDETCGALAEEFPRVEAVGLPRRRLRHADEDQVVGETAILQETPRIGHDEVDGGVG